jgi:hypothetical protein
MDYNYKNLSTEQQLILNNLFFEFHRLYERRDEDGVNVGVFSNVLRFSETKEGVVVTVGEIKLCNVSRFNPELHKVRYHSICEVFPFLKRYDYFQKEVVCDGYVNTRNLESFLKKDGHCFTLYINSSIEPENKKLCDMLYKRIYSISKAHQKVEADKRESWLVNNLNGCSDILKLDNKKK